MVPIVVTSKIKERIITQQRRRNLNTIMQQRVPCRVFVIGPVQKIAINLEIKRRIDIYTIDSFCKPLL